METSHVATPVPNSVAARAGSQALQAIGLFKIFKALLCFGAAFGLFHLLHRDTEEEARHLLKVFRISHDTALIKGLLLKANLLDDPYKKIWGGVITLYGVLFTTEGIGLMLRKRWAEWFTSILTFTGIPIELYEMFHHYTAIKLAALVINALILAFLIAHLVRTSRLHNAAPAKPALVPAEAEDEPIKVGALRE